MENVDNLNANNALESEKINVENYDSKPTIKSNMNSHNASIDWSSVINNFNLNDNMKKSNTKVNKVIKHVNFEDIDIVMKRREIGVRKIDICSFLLTLGILVLQYTENDIFISENKNEGKLKNKSNAICTMLRCLIILLTILLEITIYFHYKLKLILQKNLGLHNRTASLKSAGMRKFLIQEIIICGLVCPPYLDKTMKGVALSGKYEYSLDAVILGLSMMKSYHLLRIYRHYSSWLTEEALKICKNHKIVGNLEFAIKSEIRHRPYKFIAAVTIVTLVILGILVLLAEISFEPDPAKIDSMPPPTVTLKEIGRSMWLISVTMTTIGFGDMYPMTHIGRVFVTSSCIIGKLINV